MARLEAAFDPGFADGARALLWALPAGKPRAVLVCLQPFAEEANLSRRMIVAQARRLAARGYAVLVPDLYGTGDSAGEFEAASLARWREDVARAAALAVARTAAPLVLWGVRFGALLAADCAARLPARALLAWHAQADGGEPVAQYRRLARLRALARREPAAAGAPPPGASTAVGPSAAEPAIESGGYRIAPALIEQMQALRWPASLTCALWRIEQASVPFWHALDAPADPALFEATEQALDALGAAQPEPGHPQASAAAVPLAAPLAAPAAGATWADATPHPIATSSFADAAGERMASFESGGRLLRGVVHPAAGSVGVIVVPGQPQTRVGSHRMFVQLARALARAGYPVLRYDLAGYGDSDGEPGAHDANPEDVAAAAAALRRAMPGAARVVAWGLCDGATAAALASGRLPQLAGLVLVNPWVHDESLRAQAIVGSHYRGRLVSGAFWRRLLSGQVPVTSALREAAGHLRRAHAARGTVSHGSPAERLLQALRRTPAPACMVLSGKDLTAGEMQALLVGDKRWRELGARLQIERLPEADHTLSDSAQLQRLIDASLAFVARV